MKILNFGSMNLDYVYRVRHLVAAAETITAREQLIHCGGKGLNQSIALAKAGAEVYHAGCVGIGGESLVEKLMENGVNTEAIQKVDTIQGNAMIQVDSNGQNCIVLFGGSNRCITPDQVNKTLKNFNAGDYLVLQNEVNCLPEMVDMAYKKGMKVVLNPSPFDEKMQAVDFSKLEWLLINEVEAEQLSGSREPEEVWRLLHSVYPKLSIVLTLGKDGAYCFSGEKKIYRKAIEATAVDTTAAGDTFTGYFLAALLEGQNPEECMDRATVAAGISVTRPGAADSIPDRDEVFRKQKSELVKEYHARNAACEKGKVVFTGSSLMEMFPIEEWSKEWENSPQVYNRGVSGYTIADLKKVLDVCVCELAPAKVFINIGTNDMSDPSKSLSEIMGEYDEILTTIENQVPGVAIYLMAYYPVNYRVAPVWMKDNLAARSNEKITLANQAVEEMAKAHGQHFINVNEPLTDSRGDLKAEYTFEGMHIKPDGYRSILSKVMEYVIE